MDIELDVHVTRREKYACTCCGRKVSWRALRVGLLVLACVALASIVVARGLRTNQTLWGIAADLGLVALGLATPSW